MGCTFCDIIAGRTDCDLIDLWDDAVAFVPLDPCTRGHTLVVPRVHVARSGIKPAITGMAFERADELAERLAEQSVGWGPQWAFTDWNLAVNAGSAAGMTVPHLHVHIVPRREGDGLPMPWTPQQIAARNTVGGA